MDSIVFISVDCLRADHLGCYGYDRPTSPNIDEFAETATIFNNAYSNCPGTRWAFQSLHTGVSTLQIDGLGIPKEYTTLAEHLHKAGYVTGGFADNAFVSREYRYDTGFDTYYSTQETTSGDGWMKALGKRIDNALNSEIVRERVLVPINRRLSTGKDNRFQPAHSDEDTISAALSFLESVDKPFFLWAHLMDAHTPYGYWPNHLDVIRGDAEIKHTISPRDEGKVKLGEPPKEEVIDTYDACIRSVDEQVGRLINAVDDKTTVVFTGDHGEEFGRYGEFHESSLYSSMTQVPIIVRSPDISSGRSEMPVQHLDIAPTILYRADIDVPGYWEGAPLQTLKRSQDEPIIYTLGPDEVAVRVGNWKYIESDGDGKLYQVPHSGSESDPVTDPDRESSMQALVDEYRSLTGAVGTGKSDLNEGASNLSDDIENNLEDLGYL